MANIKDDPKVQDLIAKATEKALKAQRKAIVNQLKTVASDAIEVAKGNGDKTAAKVLKDFSVSVVDVAKTTEAEA